MPDAPAKGTLTYSYGKPFGYVGKPNTCRWCGDRLAHPKYIDPGDGRPYQAVQGGYQDNGIFCSLRCGYQWALAQFRRGKPRDAEVTTDA